MLRVDSHAWAASSTGAYWNTTETIDEKVKIVNYNDSEGNQIMPCWFDRF
jgi:hypothetical protein